MEPPECDAGIELSRQRPVWIAGLAKLRIQPWPKPKDGRLSSLPALFKDLKEESARIGGKILPHRQQTRAASSASKSAVASNLAQTRLLGFRLCSVFPSLAGVIKQRRLRFRPSQCGKKQYTCDVCGRKYTQKNNLVIHSRTHTGERPFECSSCPATFSRSDILKKQTLTHTGERPHECNLERHKIVHSGVKKFTCQFCSRKFSAKQALTEHTRTHTGEKPYLCHLCPAEFAQWSTLKKHVVTHTEPRLVVPREFVAMGRPRKNSTPEEDAAYREARRAAERDEISGGDPIQPT
ncbi:zinc finger protein 79-like [Rhipicephalus sanguineus]|uniref:zinc finger protein 79-like n=1 Tax=Rhipicephalus sanguineus TaxID=34632 RepID=UPI0020C24103|nr:zinc finger protein 79-like [Rhipicephalus sanguineus]